MWFDETKKQFTARATTSFTGFTPTKKVSLVVFLLFWIFFAKMNPFRISQYSRAIKWYCLECNFTPQYLDILLRNMPVSLNFFVKLLMVKEVLETLSAIYNRCADRFKKRTNHSAQRWHRKQPGRIRCCHSGSCANMHTKRRPS